MKQSRTKIFVNDIAVVDNNGYADGPLAGITSAFSAADELAEKIESIIDSSPGVETAALAIALAIERTTTHGNYDSVELAELVRRYTEHIRE